MTFPARSLSIAFSTAVLIALPGTLVLGAHPLASQPRLASVRVDEHPQTRAAYAKLRAANTFATPTPAPAPVVAVAPPLPVSARPAPVAVRPAPPPPPAPAPVIGSRQQALINADRAAAGLGPLTWSSCLASVAFQNAQRMAAQGFISHTNGVYLDLNCRLGNHSGENVGYTSAGINDAQLNTLFMNSPEHRANIMGPFRYVGTAWVTAPNGYGYVAVEFS
ncbi:MAG TPA: CAP domain-containing protein [Candidatus Limnocylindrales bacterium]|nr:CAP domain-containing protein [Candidatus Limnocylindrales bacterium]